MNVKHILVATGTAFALTWGGIALAAQPKTPFVSGDEPMNVGQSAQLKSPLVMTGAQENTQEILSSEGPKLSGNYPNERGGLERQVTNSAPNAREQAATEMGLEKITDQSGAIWGNYD